MVSWCSIYSVPARSPFLPSSTHSYLVQVISSLFFASRPFNCSTHTSSWIYEREVGWEWLVVGLFAKGVTHRSLAVPVRAEASPVWNFRFWANTDTGTGYTDKTALMRWMRLVQVPNGLSTVYERRRCCVLSLEPVADCFTAIVTDNLSVHIS